MTEATAAGDTPEWLNVMRAISGMAETPGSADNAKILGMRDEIARRYPDMADYCALYQHDSIPWCGLTVAYTMAMADIRPVFGPTDTDKFLWAQAWDDPSFGQKIKTPRLGCVVVLGRSGGGHVTLYERTEGSYYVCRGGNQSDAINAQKYPISNVISLVWPTAAGDLPPAPRRSLAIGDEGEDVAHVQRSLGLPADGDFGPVTESGVKGFQGAANLTVDGEVGPMTWQAIDELDRRMAAGSDGLEPEVVELITNLAETSKLINYNWRDRGRAPPGYIKGMALAFGLAVDRLADGDDAAAEMAKAMTPDAETDALKFYENEFEALGMANDEDGVATLRHLFVLLIGLGMRESSGRYYCGKDASATNTTADTCEAGLFQMSWNMKTASPAMADLYKEYRADPNGFLEIFAVDLEPTAADIMNYGTGEGVAYQWLAKYSPTFAALTAAIGTRRRRKHWGPINRREVEIVEDADVLLAKVQKLVMEVEPSPEPEPEPPSPDGEVATVSITTTGDVKLTVAVNGEILS